MRKDNKLMAMLSIWGIILVVLGHSGFTNPVIADNLSGLQRYIYSFHMPLFFFISGYLYSLTNKSFKDIKAGRFLSKKVKRLLVPYFVLGVTVFIIKYAFAGLSSVTRNFSPESFLYMFVAPHDADSTMGYLWYLITLFLVFVIVTFLSSIKVNLKRPIQGIVIIITSWTIGSILPHTDFLNLSNLLWYLPFFICGIMFYGLKGEHKISTLTDKQLTLSILMGGGIQILLIYNKLPFVPDKLISIIVAMLGILFSIFLCQYILRIDNLSTHLLIFAPQVYSIYLLSWFGQYPVQILTINILHLNWIFCFVSIFIAGIVFPLVVHKIVSKISFLKNSKFVTFSIGY